MGRPFRTETAQPVRRGRWPEIPSVRDPMMPLNQAATLRARMRHHAGRCRSARGCKAHAPVAEMQSLFNEKKHKEFVTCGA